MNIIKKIFGTPPLLDAAIKGIDASVWTSEERSDWFLKYLQMTSGQTLARRYIALNITLLVSFLILLAIFSWKFDKEWAQFMLELLNEFLLLPFSVIIGFYFATHTVRAAVNGKK